MTRRSIKYSVIGFRLLRDHPNALRVSDESDMSTIIKHFRRLIGVDAGVAMNVAYLPKDAALSIDPFFNHPDWFAANASHLECPSETRKILSLDLYEEEDHDKVQFYILFFFFSDQPEFIQPPEEFDHQIVIDRARSGTYLQHHESAAEDASEYMIYPEFIYNGRGAGGMGPPIAVYEEVFADIVDDLARLRDLPDNQDILDKIGDFAVRSLQVYSSRSERENSLYPLIETLLGVGQMIRDMDDYILMDVTSHAVAKERDAIYLHVECKNELGLDGMEQGALAMLGYITDPKYALVRNKTCCPCIHISIAGPYISFGGSILTDIYSFQPFTDYIFPGGHMMNEINTIAKVFGVFWSALNKLRDKYKKLEYFGRTRKNRARLFPQPAYLADPNIQSLAFETRFLPDGGYYSPIRRALFLANLGGQRVIVKFCMKYNQDAHHAVAKAGLAPKLHFHALLRGGVHMVIMDFIDGSDARRKFSQELPDDVVKQVKAAIAILHNMNLVHGDVRRSNILIKTEQASEAAMDTDPSRQAYRAYLVNFDRAGRASVDRYTPLLNMVINWPPGVRPSGLMEKEHDDMLLQRTIHSASEMKV